VSPELILASALPGGLAGEGKNRWTNWVTDHRACPRLCRVTDFGPCPWVTLALAYFGGFTICVSGTVSAKTNTNYTSLFSQHCDYSTNTRGGKGCIYLHVKEDSTRLCQDEDQHQFHKFLTILRFFSQALGMERDGFILAAGFFMLRRTAHVIKSIVQHSRDTQAFNKEHFYRQELN